MNKMIIPRDLSIRLVGS